MKINILLPYKDKFDIIKASSVSITVKNNLENSRYKNNIRVFGQEVENPISPSNFIAIKKPFFLTSKNKYLAIKMCEMILHDNDCNQLIEIHNRPYLLNYINKKVKNYPINIFFHNDPQNMKGSKTIEQRKFILKKANAIICVSNYIKNRFLEGIKFDKEKVSVLYNGVNRLIKSFPKKKKEVLFVGRLVPEKGVDLYVNVIESIKKHFPDWIFYIVGSSHLGNHKMESSFSQNISKKFTAIGKQAKFTGFLNYEDVQKKMQDASIIVIPSLWEEPFGLVVAEGMSNGLAIITSKVGGIPEIIGKNGIVIKNINEKKIEKALFSLMADQDICKKYQRLAWDNFNHSSETSSKALDDFRDSSLKHFIDLI